MKAFNLYPKEVQMSFGKLSTLMLGEVGRGRKMTYVPCERRFEDGEPVALSTTRSGRPKIIAGQPGSDATGWLARISTEGPYIRGAYGHVRALDPALVHVVAYGYGAFGDAGRIGRWYDYLLALQPGAVLRVKPTREEPYFLHVTVDQIVRLEQEEASVYDGVEIPVTGEDWVDLLAKEGR